MPAAISLDPRLGGQPWIADAYLLFESLPGITCLKFILLFEVPLGRFPARFHMFTTNIL